MESQETRPPSTGCSPMRSFRACAVRRDANADGFITVEEKFRYAPPSTGPGAARTWLIGTQTPQLLAPDPPGRTVMGRALHARRVAQVSTSSHGSQYGMTRARGLG